MAEKPIEEIKETISKLFDMTVENGCTPAEAERAAMHAQRLLEKYQLNKFDIKARTYSEKIIEEPYFSTYKTLPTWYAHLATSIASAYECKLVYQSYWDVEEQSEGTKLRFIGHASDAEIACFLFWVLQEKLYVMGEQQASEQGYRGRNKSQFRENFIKAAGTAIRDRLLEQKRESGEQSTALVLVKSEAVQKYWDEEFSENIRIRSLANASGVGTQEGLKAGEEIDLPTGLKEGEAPKQIA